MEGVVVKTAWKAPSPGSLYGCLLVMLRQRDLAALITDVPPLEPFAHVSLLSSSSAWRLLTLSDCTAQQSPSVHVMSLKTEWWIQTFIQEVNVLKYNPIITVIRISEPKSPALTNIHDMLNFPVQKLPPPHPTPHPTEELNSPEALDKASRTRLEQTKPACL